MMSQSKDLTGVIGRHEKMKFTFPATWSTASRIQILETPFKER